MKAMAHDPANRYASATAMLYDMDEFRKTPSILFDYNIPPTDAVTQLAANLETMMPKKTTAERVAAGGGTPRRRQPAQSGSQQRRAEPARRPANAPKTNPPKRRRDAYEEEEERSKIATIAVVACSAVAVIAIIVFLIALFGSGASGDDQLVNVPTLVGKNYDMLQISDDFVLKPPNLEYNDQYEKGQIFKQMPDPGQTVGRGTEIHIWVSRGPEPQVKTMENLVNQERATAENFLTGQGMKVLIEEENSDEIAEGRVVRTDPKEGETLEDGQKITLYISKGPEIKRRDMPVVVGQSLETAKTILDAQKLGLVVKEIEETSNTVEEGYIIRTEPAASELIQTGDTVTLYVSKGPEKAKMPDLLGEDITTAIKMLNAAGFSNITYEEYVESEEPKDTVVEQSVVSGDEVPVTTTVVLKLSEGPKPKEVTKMVGFGLMEDALEAYPVKIVRKDTGEVVFEATIAASKTAIELELTGIGKVTYVVNLAGNSYEQEVDFDTP